jgi:SAM-dependent methyltransferase
MIDPRIHKIIKTIIDDSASVIDIGGGRNPYSRANYILDKREHGQHVGKISDGCSERSPLFSNKTWISRDFYELPWPFADKQFDFSLCMGTLEDVRDPLPIIKEIQRISKAGYISMPTRACESSPWVRGRSSLSEGLAGYQHHRWFVEIIGNALVFKFKSPLVYAHRHFLIENYGQHTLNFFWADSFEYREQYLGTLPDILDDYQLFYEKHKAWFQKAANGQIDEAFYNRWDTRLGPYPDFSCFFEPDVPVPSKKPATKNHSLITHLKQRIIGSGK